MLGDARRSPRTGAVPELEEPLPRRDARVRRVLIADNHPIVREGLRTRLGTLPDFELAGEVATGVEAVGAAAGAPDIVVMDLQIPELKGIGAIRRIVAARPGTAYAC